MKSVNEFVHRRGVFLERSSSMLLMAGVGHLSLRSIGNAGLGVALALVFCASLFRVYLGRVTTGRIATSQN